MQIIIPGTACESRFPRHPHFLTWGRMAVSPRCWCGGRSTQQHRSRWLRVRTRSATAAVGQHSRVDSKQWGGGDTSSSTTERRGQRILQQYSTESKHETCKKTEQKKYHYGRKHKGCFIISKNVKTVIIFAYKLINVARVSDVADNSSIYLVVNLLHTAHSKQKITRNTCRVSKGNT